MYQIGRVTNINSQRVRYAVAPGFCILYVQLYTVHVRDVRPRARARARVGARARARYTVYS